MKNTLQITKKVLDNPDLLDYIYDYLSVRPETIELYINNKKLQEYIKINDNFLESFLKFFKDNKINSSDVKRLYVLDKYILIFMNNKSIYKYTIRDKYSLFFLILYFCNHFKNLTEIFNESHHSDKDLENMISYFQTLLNPKTYSKINILLRNENGIFSNYNGY